MSEVFCRYPGCVACCPEGCKLAIRRTIEHWVRTGSYANARIFWEIHFEGAAHVEQAGHREKQGR